MRASRFLIATLKETPADAEVISHQLMLRAGLIRKLASGLYSWLPLGLRVLRKVEQIVREEMDAADAQELLMPAVQPAELWQESERWFAYGDELLRVKDRHERDFCVGPTHEEVITDIARHEIKSYKQLPCNFYQIQTKFRDERRPRFGVMRAREFIMKDAYSFHLSDASLDDTYQRMHLAYTNIFTRLGLDFRAVQADSGSIGGNASHEFHVLADSGEDAIAFSSASPYAANIELAEAVAVEPAPAAANTCTLEDTPVEKTIEAVAERLQVSPAQTLKTLIVEGEAVDGEMAEGEHTTPLVALVLRGDHSLNEIKAEKLPGVKTPLTFASDAQIQAALGCEPGFIGPVDLNITTLADHSAAAASGFVCGANQNGKHYKGAHWEKDARYDQTVDIRNAVEGDASPDGHGVLEIKRGIEVGHIFKLGQKYSQAMNATVLNEQGKAQTLTMGCYGIGVSRVVAAAIEQNHDDRGIIWPAALAPFQVALAPLNMHKSDAVRDAAEQLYQQLQAAGIDVLLDDRNERPGVKFADLELMGIPHRVVISDRGLKEGTLEYKGRRDSDSQHIAVADAMTFVQNQLS